MRHFITRTTFVFILFTLFGGSAQAQNCGVYFKKEDYFNNTPTEGKDLKEVSGLGHTLALTTPDGKKNVFQGCYAVYNLRKEDRELGFKVKYFMQFDHPYFGTVGPSTYYTLAILFTEGELHAYVRYVDETSGYTKRNGKTVFNVCDSYWVLVCNKKAALAEPDLDHPVIICYLTIAEYKRRKMPFEFLSIMEPEFIPQVMTFINSDLTLTTLEVVEYYNNLKSGHPEKEVTTVINCKE